MFKENQKMAIYSVRICPTRIQSIVDFHENIPIIMTFSWPWMRKIRYLLFSLFILSSTLVAGNWYVRPASGNYGLENGTSYANAWDGLRNVKWGAGGVQPGDTLYICGTHIRDHTSVSMPVDAYRITPTSGTSDSNRVTIRGDYPGDHGYIYGWRQKNTTWTYEGDGTYSITQIASIFPDFILQDCSGSSHVLLTPVSSVNECKSTPGSHYAANYSSGYTLYVHLTDGGDPTERVVLNCFGYQWWLGSQSQYITFKNLNIYQHYRFVDTTPGNYYSHVTFDGCKIYYGCDGKANIRVNGGGSDIKIRNCELAYGNNGFYSISITGYNPVDNWEVSNSVIHDMGTRSATQDIDAHGIGIQGGNNAIVENNYIYNCGSGITLYSGVNTDMKNNIVRYNFVRDTHTYGGANSRGIETVCNNQSLSDKSGNKFYYNIVMNCEVGYRFQWEDEQEVYNNIAFNCGVGLASERSYLSYGPKVKARNNIFCNSRTHHIKFLTSATDAYANFDFNFYYPDGPDKFKLWVASTTNFAGWQSYSRPGYTFDPNSRIADPLFLSPANENFQLQPSSPAIDAGVYVGLSHDRQGTPIPQGFAPDIGAYEYVFASNPLVINASASPTQGNTPLTVNFTGSASGGSPPYSYNWSFGDGQSSSSQNPSHTYSSASNYTATLTVTDSKGTNANNSVSITVTSPPPQLVASASASPTSGTAPLTVSFSGSATGGTPPYSYIWNFGDGGTSTAQNPTHTYSAAGNYIAILAVTDSQSAQNSASVSITVSSVPKTLSASASASPTSGQPPLTVNFTGSASGGVAPYSYSWNFGDGSSSTAQNPSHTYSATGSYTATLTVADKNSASSSATVIITVSTISAYNLSIASETGAPASGQGGTTNPSPGNHSFPVGSIAEVRSIPNQDYRFSKWAGDIVETSLFSQQAIISMDRNISLTATFCATCGDVNGDLKITPSDAQAAFDIFLGKITNPTWCEKENADVNNSGTKLEPKVTPADAQVIFNKYLRRGELPSDCSGYFRSEAGSMQTANLSGSNLFIETTIPEDSKDIFVSIIVESSTDISAFGIDISFLSDEIAFIGFERTALTEDFEQLDANVLCYQKQQDESGDPISIRNLFTELEKNYLGEGEAQPLSDVAKNPVLRVGGFKTTNTSGPSSGVLITLIFRVTEEIKEETPISIVATYDDLQNSIVQYRMINSKRNSGENKGSTRANDREFIGKRYDF
ncbi:MAG: PKD domain-containing protein [Clostridiales bacterium]|nr:PKD domain-containing protein [Clostridiales bacterium]